MEKKGVELSVNVIIIAAISLIVLVLLSFLVLRTGPGITTGTSCAAFGGECIPSGAKCDDEVGPGWTRDITKSCTSEEREAGLTLCCIRAGAN